MEIGGKKREEMYRKVYCFTIHFLSFLNHTYSIISKFVCKDTEMT